MPIGHFADDPPDEEALELVKLVLTMQERGASLSEIVRAVALALASKEEGAKEAAR